MNALSRWRHSTGVAAIVFSVAVCPRAIQAQEAAPTFRTSVALVPITAVVRDSKNRVVTELRKEDFEVLEDNRPRRVIDFSATTRGPLSLGLLVDTSGSMQGRNLETGRAIINHLLDHLEHASDEAALFTFDKAMSQDTPFTNDRDRIRRALDNATSWGVTSLYDAIAETAKRLGERNAERRAVIVLTDGVDTSSALAPSDASRLAKAVDVPVYIVSVISARRSPDGSVAPPSDDAVRNLAYWTGGDVRYVTAADQVSSAVSTLIAELRQQYFLAIESASSSGWYRLDVRTKRKGLTVRARSGYFAGTDSQPQR